ncbi:hypothetical protein [Microcoleus sp. N9_A1]|uniref:hypothetical protein n=1 Tax=Microcoleus sp. N9_A1 TaxID=3055380 RepID=UPI002FCF16E1
MNRKWILYDKDDRQVTWPTCINNLSPIKNALGSELPTWIKQAFNRKGIFNEDEMVVPIHPISVLGQCSTAKYIDCPNIPGHHIENARVCGGARYLDGIGKYYWFDFDLVSSDGTLIKLRMVVNTGDADCNDGLWGAVWRRNTGELVANILSSGDMETTIQAVSKKCIDLYKSYDIWIPLLFTTHKYANNLELEKLVDLAIQICFYPKAEITDTGNISLWE